LYQNELLYKCKDMVSHYEVVVAAVGAHRCSERWKWRAADSHI